MCHPWDQQENESSRAFEAFSRYRDLGPNRSLVEAYKIYRAGQPGRAPGQWNVWSRDYDWVKRAQGYDAHVDAELRRVRFDLIKKLEERRFEFELKDQGRIERRIGKAEAVLDKADLAPITDVTQEKKDAGGETSTKVKGIDFAGYAKLMSETNKAARQAILGVRPEKPEADNGADKSSGGVKGIVFVPEKEEPTS